jgi:hypothetical protein
MSDMAVLEAYARLKSLRQNLPGYDVEMRFVNEFHQILDLLHQGTGVDLANFRIPPSELRPIVVAGNYLDGSVEYTDEPFCNNAYFLMKVDGVLNMFEVLLAPSSGPKPSIGFKPRR